jgi:hypothetical protein
MHVGEAPTRQAPCALNNYVADHAALLLDSYERFTGRQLLPAGPSPAQRARALFEAPFVVVSHDTAADPVLTYGNLAALALWETDWATLTRLPSRLTAEPLERAERQRLLARVSRDGFIDDYSGIRVSASGRRFRIEGATVWNLVDAAARHLGQAAAFSNWEFL